MGRTFVHLLTGHHPLDFYDPNIHELNWENAGSDISAKLRNFLNELMGYFPRQRPTNTQIILEKLKQIEQNSDTYSQTTIITKPPSSIVKPKINPHKPQAQKPQGVKYKLLLVGIISLIFSNACDDYSAIYPPSQLQLPNTRRI